MTAPASADARDQRAGLARVHLAQAVGVERSGARMPAALEIDRLAADHAGGARGVGDDARSPRACGALSRGDDVRIGRRLAREQRERFGQQRVAGEDRHALAEDDVRGRPAAAQRVVVHRRQVVVDERIGVNHLERAGRRQRQRVRGLVGVLAELLGDRFGGGERQHRTQPLAAGEQAVAHRLGDVGGGRAGAGAGDSARARRRPRARRASSQASERLEVASPALTALVAVGVGASDAGAGLISPRSLRISMRRSASSSLEWQKRDSCTPRSKSSSDFSSARSPSSSVLTIVSSSAIADSKSLMVGSMSRLFFTLLRRDTRSPVRLRAA